MTKGVGRWPAHRSQLAHSCILLIHLVALLVAVFDGWGSRLMTENSSLRVH
jgi:hypothetical protein